MAQQAGRVSTKSEVVQIRLSGADKDELLRAADRVGLSLSAWIRMVLLTEARASMYSRKRSSPK